MPRTSEFRSAICVFVADGNLLKCQLLVSALQGSRQRITVVGSAAESIGIRKGLKENRVDVAVVSGELRDGPLAGLEMAREIRTSYPAVRIIVLVDSPAAALIVEAFRAGADGVLCRDDSFDVLCKCIHAVHEGQVWANSGQVRILIGALAKGAPAANLKGVGATSSLTHREEGLVQLVAQGFTNREIARQLNLSEHTIRNYLFRIFNKLGTSNRLELALYAINRRLTPRSAIAETNVEKVS